MFGASDRLSHLSSGLEALSLHCRSVRADSPAPLKSRYWAAGVIMADTADDVSAGLDAFKRFAHRDLPVIVLSHDRFELDPRVDSWIHDPAPAIQVAARIRALFRLHAMEDIARRRADVTALYGRRPFEIEPIEGDPQILYVGQASPRFMALQHVMEDSGSELTAAFSSYSAFDYLHERPFDAVVLNAEGQTDFAFTISSAMRRNARLYHTPVLLLSECDNRDSAEEAYARGVSDILPRGVDDKDVRDRVHALTRERRRRRAAKAALDACRDTRTLDHETGLFHAGFLTSHLQDLIQMSKDTHSPFCVCVLQTLLPDGVDAPDEASAEKARRQFASMLRHLLRSEDAAARFEHDTFIAVLPFTDHVGVEQVASRVSAIADCTAFESDDPHHPFRLTVRTAASEARPDETAEALIERTLSRLNAPASSVAAS